MNMVLRARLDVKDFQSVDTVIPLCSSVASMPVVHKMCTGVVLKLDYGLE